MDIETLDKVLEVFTKILIIFLILPVHEYAHAWAAHKMGDDTAAYSGRLTLNPLAHIDIVGALCLLFTRFGWAKPVPINPLKFRKQRLGIAVTAAAGPLSNLIVAVIAMIVYRVVTSLGVFTDCIEPLYQIYSNIDNVLAQPLMASSLVYTAAGGTALFFLLYILECFISINVGLAIFNLIPIPPLDGSKILSYFTTAKFDRWIYEHQMIVNLVFLGVILTGILNRPLTFIGSHIIDLFFLITGFIPKLMGA
ncbi:MAG: site-2 protease family protein [Oscillospiraceae bacterium]|nr:site-2 protease family protein [Oscillospiraceae bacterium]